MKLIFGDSLTSGENNNFVGYVEYLNKMPELKNALLKNFGVSGTCIGDYSIYPVGANNLIQLLYKNSDQIKLADSIFLEYGTNDITSLTADYINKSSIEIDLIKCLDYIKQINPDIVIYFILLGDNKVKMAKAQADYINNDYLKSSNVRINGIRWLGNYVNFEKFVKNLDVKIIELPSLSSEMIDTDNMHPNDTGYLKIAEVLKPYIMENN